MAYNQYSTYYPTPAVTPTYNMYPASAPQYNPNTYGYSGMNGMNGVSGQGMQNMQNMPNMQNMQSVQGTQNMPNQGMSNQNMMYQNQQAIPNMSSMGSNHKTVNGNNDIVWVQSDEEVFNYPVAQDTNQMFFDIYRMKMFTKEGSTGLVRDFDLHESPESIQRYQQQQQIQNMEFPVIETTADVVDTEKQADALIDAIERKMEERFSDFENRLSQLSDSVNEANTVSTPTTETVKKTSGKSMTKR